MAQLPGDLGSIVSAFDTKVVAAVLETGVDVKSVSRTELYVKKRGADAPTDVEIYFTDAANPDFTKVPAEVEVEFSDSRKTMFQRKPDLGGKVLTYARVM